jgi:hypothetical protein
VRRETLTNPADEASLLSRDPTLQRAALMVFQCIELTSFRFDIIESAAFFRYIPNQNFTSSREINVH